MKYGQAERSARVVVTLSVGAVERDNVVSADTASHPAVHALL